MKKFATIVMAAGALALGACDDDDNPVDVPETALYEVQVIDETFTVRAEDQAAIDALDARLASGEEGVVLGELAMGDGGFNAPWSWHMVPGTIQAPDMATEVCDGRPSFVEEDVDYWVNTVERYCPFSAEVVQRLD